MRARGRRGGLGDWHGIVAGGAGGGQHENRGARRTHGIMARVCVRLTRLQVILEKSVSIIKLPK